MSEISLGTIELEKGGQVGGYSVNSNLEAQLDLLRVTWMQHREAENTEQAKIAMSGINAVLDIYNEIRFN